MGPYAKALEFATSSEAVVIGKPSSKFFEGALRKLNVSAEEVLLPKCIGHVQCTCAVCVCVCVCVCVHVHACIKCEGVYFLLCV